MRVRCRHGGEVVTAPVGLREQIAAAIEAPLNQIDPWASEIVDAVLSVVAGQVDALADVLAEHAGFHFDGNADTYVCDCGRTLGYPDEAYRHRRHVAEFLVARMVGGER